MLRLVESLVLATVALAPTEALRPQSEHRVEDGTIVADSPTLALIGVRVIDGTGQAPTGGLTIVITDGRISAIGAKGGVPIPEGAERLELEGRTVIPGLVMLHEHLNYFSGRAVWHSQPVSFPSLYLAGGVTTIRTAGTESPAVDLNLRKRIDEGIAIGPSLHLTAPFFNGPEGGFLGDFVLTTPEAARKAVDYWAEAGFTSFKVYSEIESEVLAAVIEAAHARGLTVAGHLGKVTCREAATLGIDTIEHSLGACSEIAAERPELSDPELQALIRHLIESGVVIVTTPMAPQGKRSSEELDMLHPQARENYLRAAIDPPEWWPSPAEIRWQLAVDRLFVEAGGRLGVGSDPGNPDGGIAGYANQRALELLVQAGWTPLEVIRLATSNNAEILGVGGFVGRIAAGLAADLVVVTGDPSKNIQDLSHPEIVFKKGVGYSPKRLRAAVKGKVGWH